MKLNIKKIVCAAIASLTLFSVAACGGKPIGGTVIGTVDKTKTQLKVYNYDGGVGHVWLDKVIKRFEEDYKDVSFEQGKTGVVITPDNSKTQVFGSIASNPNNVIFAEIADYSKLVSSGEIIDITDIMTKPLNQVTKTTDTKTIKSKMYDETIDYYTFKDNTKMYAAPHYAFFSTLTYNKQLLIDKKLYFAKNYDVNAKDDDKFITAQKPDKSCGPDGQYGTDDDGLPATWDEMFILFNQMKQNGVTPIAWAGREASGGGYVNYMLNAIYLSLAGKEQAMLNYTFDSKGKTIEIVEKNGNGFEVKKEVINAENYKKMNSELAKYQAIKIVDKILDTPAWQDFECVKDTTSMLDCQQRYIESYNRGYPIAILTEGSYWYNEASDANHFEDVRGNFSDFDEKNDFQIMPLPRVYNGTYKDVEGKTIGKPVYADQADSLAVVNANIAKEEDLVKLAKTFIAYCYTDESLKEFTETTRVTRSLKYDVDVNKLDAWAKATWNYTKSADVVLPYSRSDLFLNNKSNLSMHIANAFWNVNMKNVYKQCKDGTADSYFAEYMTR